MAKRFDYLTQSLRMTQVRKAIDIDFLAYPIFHMISTAFFPGLLIAVTIFAQTTLLCLYRQDFYILLPNG